MFRSITMTAVAALLAGPVFADGVNYTRLSYDFTNYDSDFGLEGDASLLQGTVEYEISQFLLSADILNLDFDGSSSTAYGVAGAYMFTPEALAGLGVFGNDPDSGDNTTGFEVFGQYETAQFGVGLNVTKDDTDEDNVTTTLVGEAEVTSGVTLGASVATESESDGTDYVLSADYDLGPIEARAAVSGTSEDDGGLFGVRGSYEFTPQFRASASYQTSYGDDLVDESVFTVGGGYQIVDGLWFDANYGIIDSDDYSDDIDRIQATLTFETGTQKRIDRRFSQASIDDLQAGAGVGFNF